MQIINWVSDSESAIRFAIKVQFSHFGHFRSSWLSVHFIEDDTLFLQEAQLLLTNRPLLMHADIPFCVAQSCPLVN